jgi:hypothetical protein
MTPSVSDAAVAWLQTELNWRIAMAEGAYLSYEVGEMSRDEWRVYDRDAYEAAVVLMAACKTICNEVMEWFNGEDSNG